MAINPQQRDIWQVNLDPTIGQEIKKIRPVVVIISNIYNPIALRIIILITTWQDKFLERPFMVKMALHHCGMICNYLLLVNNIY